jgi:3-oxoacyl-[acyl-carrier-protein] synthase-3
MRNRTAAFAGVGKSLPERVMTNHDLEKIVETSDDWITQRVGISERRIASEGQPSSVCAIDAARKALAMARMDVADIGCIIVATSTPDYVYPSTACCVQTALGARKAAVFDLSAACTGFVYATGVAWSMIRSGMTENALVIGTEVNSSIVNWEDRSTCVLFGDGAGACVLKACDANDGGILDVYLDGDGEHKDMLKVINSGSCRQDTMENERKRYIEMRGNELFKIAVRSMVDAANVVLERCDLKADDVDLLIPHQANTRIIDAVSKRLGIPDDKVFVNIQKYGNTSAATIPIALCEALEEGRVKKGDLVVLDAFGGGFTWGAVALKWI